MKFSVFCGKVRWSVIECINFITVTGCQSGISKGGDGETACYRPAKVTQQAYFKKRRKKIKKRIVECIFKAIFVFIELLREIICFLELMTLFLLPCIVHSSEALCDISLCTRALGLEYLTSTATLTWKCNTSDTAAPTKDGA